MTSEWPKDETDHKDTDKINNKWNNLREAKHINNQHNKNPPKTNTSGYKGVCWHKRDKKWHAMIKVNGKQVHIGQFTNIEDAIIARQNYAKLYHGEFARETLK
jgi:hypothetical protein